MTKLLREKEDLRREIKKKVLRILNNNPDKLIPIGGWDFIDIEWRIIKSMEKKGLIKIFPFPQGKEIFIGLKK